MPTTITANGASEAIYLDMSGSIVIYSIGSLTAPASWVAIPNTAAWPVTITNSPSPGASTILNVVFVNSLTITGSYGAASGYFITGSSYITFNGANYNINITSVGSYPGFIQNGTSAAAGRANIVVTNINTSITGSSLFRSGDNSGGWICQSYFSRGVSGNSIQNCTNNIGGDTEQYGGGIAGSYAGSYGGSISFTTCRQNNAGTGSYGGGISGYRTAYNLGMATFTDCVNDGTFQDYAGGITGANSGSGIGGGNTTTGGTLIFTNCTNNRTLNRFYIGGIAGPYVCQYVGNATFTNCTNNGDLSSDNTGGLVGIYAANDQGSITFTNCTNNGSLTSTNGGGLVAKSAAEFVTPYTRGTITFTNCTNNANIASSAGGLIGRDANGIINITSCKNIGFVSGAGAGGLIGGGSGAILTITNCINSGDVFGNGSGGIIGADNSGMTSCTNCASIGAVISGPNAGGIVGNRNDNTTIRNCFSTALISGTSAGGIAGTNFGRFPSANNSAGITNCYSTGNITGGTAGGITSTTAGNATYTSSITNCYSLGNISVSSAGIAYDFASSNKLTISNCYSFGTVGAPGSGIVSPTSTQPLSLENCYVANNNWNDTTANASLTGDPSGIGILNGQAGTWTSISANTPYLLSSFFSLASNKVVQQIYTPDSTTTGNNGTSPPGYYQPGIYSIINTSQSGSTLTVNVGVIPNTPPKYSSYGYTSYTIINVNGAWGRPITATINSTTGVISFIVPRACFLEGTKILCFENNKEVYRPIESLRKGDLVKTIYNGYLPIHKIGTGPIYNPNNDDRISDRLYKCSKEKYPALFEDLYITGCHSILVPRLTYEQGLITMASLGKLYVTDKHCRLMAWVDEKSEPYTEAGIYNIYHIALENKDYYMNYGIYANGLLVETCSKRFLTEMSNMRILGEEDNSVTEDELSVEENIFHHMPRLVDIC